MGNIGQNFQHSFCSFAAGGAFTAGFILAEIHEESGHVHGAFIFVHNNQTAGTHDGAEFDNLFIINGSIQVLNRNHAAGRTAQLRCFEFFAFGNATADIINENFCSFALFRADRSVPFRSA